MNKLKIILALALCAMLASSCAYKRLTYLQDLEVGSQSFVQMRPDAKIARGDKLNILVTAKNPELAAPFNIASGVSGVDESSGQTSGASFSQTTMPYTVDNHGEISMPVLGKLYVEGLTLDELKLGLEEEIATRNYIKEPIVVVEFLNFQVYMMGEVSRKGPITISNGNVNIIEAILMAGDLSDVAVRDDIRVIRTEGNVRTVYSVNLLSKDCYESPAFYLKQNDIIYARPNKAKFDTAQSLLMNIPTLLLTFLTSVSSLLLYFKL